MIQTTYGPWAVVTGASSGIGRAFTEHLAASGINVVVASRSAELLRDVGEAISHAHGVHHRVVAVDLSDPGGAATLTSATDDLDVGLLVSNAGDAIPGDFLQRDLDRLHRELTLNAVSHLELVHHYGRRLADRGRGGIIMTSASGGFHGMPHMANTAAAKGYVHHLGEALHHELRTQGVDVTVLLPGNVDTPLVERIGLKPSDLPVSLLSPQAAVEEAMRALTSGRATLVPGRKLRTIMRLVPRGMSVRMNGRLMARAAAVVAEREAARSAPDAS